MVRRLMRPQALRNGDLPRFAHGRDRGGQLFNDRTRERARKVADDARISAFDRLGDYSRALAILERRLGTPAK